MQKQIKFIYTLLIITIIGGGISFLILKKSDNVQLSIENLKFGNNTSLVINKKAKNIEDLATAKYMSLYEHGFKSAEDGGGSLTVYPVSDKTIRFCMSLSRGAPTYNSGDIYDQVVDINNEGIGYFSREMYEGMRACHFSFHFTDTDVTISEYEDNHPGDYFPDIHCGLGNGVYPYGVYKKIPSSSIPEYCNPPKK